MAKKETKKEVAPVKEAPVKEETSIKIEVKART